MKMQIFTAALIAASFASPAFADDKDEIRAIPLERWCAADKAQDIEAFLALFTPDAVVMVPGLDPLVGTAAIRTWQEENYARENWDCHGRGQVDKIEVHGNRAFARGAWGGVLTPKDGSEASELSGYFFNVLRRQDDGGWRLDRAIWNLRAE